jgi:hemolysin III
MASTSPLDYDPQEELINAYSHGLGAILAFIAVIFLIVKGYGLPLGQWISLWVYGLSLVLLLSSSMLYHFAQDELKRYWYKKLDHKFHHPTKHVII